LPKRSDTPKDTLSTQISPVAKISDPLKPVRMSRRQLLIAKALGDSSLTQRQIAKQYGVSEVTVWKVAKKIRESSPTVEEELGEYRKLLRERVPLSRRVECIQAIVDPKRAQTNPFAVVRAIEYADSVGGLAPKQQLPADTDQKPIALFMLPTESKVSISVESRTNTGGIDSAINITPVDTKDSE
jgi:biotin operon repressor